MEQKGEGDSLGRIGALMGSMLDTSERNWPRQLSAFMTRMSLMHVLWVNHLYQQIVDVPGVIVEFGVHRGSTLGLLTEFRGIYEPFNHMRRVIGFDTFEGFPSVGSRDVAARFPGTKPSAQEGDFSVPEGFHESLCELMALKESLSPIPTVRKFEVVKGNVTDTLPAWLEANPGLLIALVIFDLDLFEPTLAAANLVKDRLVPGGLVVFDEFSDPEFPGETEAYLEAFRGCTRRLYRSPLHPGGAYFRWGDGLTT